MMYDCEVDESPFGKWNNLEERQQELASRLHAWYLSTEHLPELFAEAQRKMADELNQYEDPMDAPKTILLKAFEDALDDYDQILRTFPESIKGWCENE